MSARSATGESTPALPVATRVAVWGVIVLAAAALLVRMAPDDALGALATLAGIPMAVVLLALAALLLGAMILIRRLPAPTRGDVVAGYVCLVMAIVTGVLGVLSF